MSGQHTQGRLHVCSHSDKRLRNAAGKWVADTASVLNPDSGAANARRLAACWNACEGISTEVLDHPMAYPLQAQLAEHSRLWAKAVEQKESACAERDQLRADLDSQIKAIHALFPVVDAREAERDAAFALLREVLAGAPHLTVGMQGRIKDVLEGRS